MYRRVRNSLTNPTASIIEIYLTPFRTDRLSSQLLQSSLVTRNTTLKAIQSITHLYVDYNTMCLTHSPITSVSRYPPAIQEESLFVGELREYTYWFSIDCAKKQSTPVTYLFIRDLFSPHIVFMNHQISYLSSLEYQHLTNQLSSSSKIFSFNQLSCNIRSRFQYTYFSLNLNNITKMYTRKIKFIYFIISLIDKTVL